MTSSDLRHIREIVQTHMDRGEISGGIVLVSCDGEIKYLEAQGQSAVEPKVALRPDTVFWVASMTKPIVAASILMLMEEGAVRLDDGVEKYIPEFAKSRLVRVLKPGSPPIPAFGGFVPPDPNAPAPQYDHEPAQRPLTVRDFMTFTSGLQTIGVQNDAIPPITSEDTVGSWVAKLGDVPLEHQPGTRWHYSNTVGSEVLVRIAEVASGRPYAELLQDRLFTPLGMKTASFGVRADLRARSLPLGDALEAAIGPLLTARFTSGSAGLRMTIEDYWRFAQMLLNEGELDGRRYLSAASVREMSRNQIGDLPFLGVRCLEYAGRDNIGNPGLGYGYGVAVVTDAARSGMFLPSGSYGWDGIGTRRVWIMPSLKTVLIMLMPDYLNVADPAHEEIERHVTATVPRLRAGQAIVSD